METIKTNLDRITLLLKVIKWFFVTILMGCILLVAGAISLNYLSPYFRYPLANWLKSELEKNQIHLSAIESVELEPTLKTNTILLEGLEIGFGEVSIEGIENPFLKKWLEQIQKEQALQKVKVARLELEIDFIQFLTQGTLIKELTIAKFEANDGVLMSLVSLLQNLKTRKEEAKPLSKPLQTLDDWLPFFPLSEVQWVEGLTLENIQFKGFGFDLPLKKVQLQSLDGFSFQALIDKPHQSQSPSLTQINLQLTAQGLQFELAQLPVDQIAQSLHKLKLTSANTIQSAGLLDAVGVYDLSTQTLQVKKWQLERGGDMIKGEAFYDHYNKKHLRLTAQAFDIKASSITKILSQFPLKPKLNNWLQLALKDTHIQSLDIQTDTFWDDWLKDGKLVEDFWRSKDAFSVNLMALSQNFTFHPLWRGLEGIQTQVSINPQKVSIQAQSDKGLANGFFIDYVDAEVSPLFGKPELAIDAKASGEAEVLIDWLNQSVVGEKKGFKAFYPMGLSGEFEGEFKMTMGLKPTPPQKPQPQFSTRLQLKKGALNVAPHFNQTAMTTLNDIEGWIEVDNQKESLVSAKLKAKWLQSESEVSLSQKNNKMTIQSDTLFALPKSWPHLTLEQLSQQNNKTDHWMTFLPKAFAQSLYGSAVIQSQWVLDFDPSNALSHIKASIRSSEESQLTPPKPNLNLNFKLNGDFQKLGVQKPWMFVADKLPDETLKAEVVGSIKPYQENPLEIEKAQLGADWLIFNKVLNSQGKPSFDISMKQLVVEKEDEDEEIDKEKLHKVMSFLVKSWPQAKVVVYDLHFRGLELGNIQAEINAQTQHKDKTTDDENSGENNDGSNITTRFKTELSSLVIRPIIVTSSKVQFVAEVVVENDITNLKLRATNRDLELSDLLHYFDKEPFTQKAQAQAQASLSWPGYPWQFKLSHTQGSLKAQAKSGLLLSNSGSFQSRLLGELTVKSITDRLGNLLFSSSLEKKVQAINPFTVFEKGIAFDLMDLNFDLMLGELIAKKVGIESESLKIDLKGSADLNQQSLQFVADVNPNLLKTAPIIFGLLNPTLGVLTWLGEQLNIIKSKGDSVAKTSYLIQGDFENPIIKRQGSTQKAN